MKQYRILITILILIFPIWLHAEVYISEIMYDVSGSDSGREWVEIYNSGPSSVDTAGWKFLESASASNHSLAQIQGTGVIPSQGSMVIVSDPAKFTLDNPSFSGNLFKASFSSLNNTSGTVIIKDGSLVVQDQVAYASSQGANGDGNSLQKASSGWSAGLPTPGVHSGAVTPGSNSTTTSTTDSSSQPSVPSDSSSSSSAHSSPVPLSDDEPKLDFEVSAGRDRLTTVGNYIGFIAVPTKLIGVTVQAITYNWSFGDGTVEQGNMVSHVYRMPGDYVVVLNGSFSDKQAVSRLNVHVVSADLLVSFVPDGIEIFNKSKSEINLEGWSLVTDKKSFTIPKDTLVPALKKVVLANEITGLLSTSVRLINPLGKDVAVITKPTPPIVATSTTQDIQSIQNKISALQSEISKITKTDTPVSKIVTKVETKQEAKTAIVNASKNTQTASAVTVFEAKKEGSAVSRFFGFFRRLFVED